MPGPQRLSGEAFAIERLREDPNLDYAALRRQAADAGVSMMPIQYGRARKQLGLPPLKGPDAAGRAPAASATRSDDDRDERDERDERVQPVAGETVAGEDETAHDDGAQQDAGAADAHGDEDPHEPAPAASEVDLVAPRRKGSAAFDFLVQELRREPHAAYGELRDRCAAKGWKVAPIMYGRAKAVLGLVPVKPRGSGKKAAAAAAMPQAPRTLKQVESVAADRFTRQLEEVRNLDQLVSVVKELDAERRRLRALLERIVELIDEALG